MNRSEIQFPPKHAALRDDVHALGELIGHVLREQGGDALYEAVEADRRLAIQWRADGGEMAAELRARTSDRPPALASELTRAFSMWFQSVNLAEKVHRVRRRREYFLHDQARPQPGGIESALAQLRDQGLSLPDVLALLQQLRIEPVFTAHPTESTRRTILRKQQRLAELLFDRLDPTLTPYQQRGIWARVRMELTTGWQTADHPRERLTVSDEREHVIFYLSEVLYRILPALYDEIEQALLKLYGPQSAPLDLPTIFRFGTWVGGDMDGNPDVHAKSIRETLARQQQVIVNAYFNECQSLSQQLSQSASRIGVSPELQQRIQDYGTLVPAARAAAPSRHDRMPYRVFLGQVAERLRMTYEARPNGYESPSHLLRDLQLVADSLSGNRGEHAGLLPVRRLMRRIRTFGFHLATLDVRQHASIHHRVIAQALDDPQWEQYGAVERHRLLVDAIERDLGPRGELDALARRTLGVFEAMLQCRHRYGPEAVGFYVVGGVEDPSDVLAPLLIARWAEAYDKRTGEVALDIAPQFESIDALAGCGQTMRELLDDPLYRRHLEAHSRTQCALLGYSESSLEGGIVASRVSIHRAQLQLADVLRQANETHVIFHARGASIARGGGRIDSVVQSSPRSTITGRLRLTEQGEVINQNYGLRPIAMRTLERAFNALSLAVREAGSGAAGGASAEEGGGEVATTLLVASQQRYRGLVWENQDFFRYFSAVTPIDVIERMQIGSRPATHPDRTGLAALRAVSWVFAWTQTRALLPGWFGAGTGLRSAIETHGLETVREALRASPFLRSLVEDVEAMLGRTDLQVAACYNSLAGPELQHCFAALQQEFALARAAVLEIQDTRELLTGNATLQRAIQLRSPYVDPMNLMQIDLLRRWRAGGRQDRDLFEALLSTVGGIAQGLQSTG